MLLITQALRIDKKTHLSRTILRQVLEDESQETKKALDSSEVNQAHLFTDLFSAITFNIYICKCMLKFITVFYITGKILLRNRADKIKLQMEKIVFECTCSII